MKLKKFRVFTKIIFQQKLFYNIINYKKSVWKTKITNDKYVRFQNGRPKSRYLLLSNQTIKFFLANGMVQLFLKVIRQTAQPWFKILYSHTFSALKIEKSVIQISLNIVGFLTNRELRNLYSEKNVECQKICVHFSFKIAHLKTFLEHCVTFQTPTAHKETEDKYEISLKAKTIL